MAQANAANGALPVASLETNGAGGGVLTGVMNYVLSWFSLGGGDRTKDTERERPTSRPSSPISRKRTSEDETSSEEEPTKKRRNTPQTNEQSVPSITSSNAKSIIAEPIVPAFYPSKHKGRDVKGKEILNNVYNRRNAIGYPAYSAHAARKYRDGKVTYHGALLRLKNRPAIDQQAFAQRQKAEEAKRRLERAQESKDFKKRSKEFYGDVKKNHLIIGHLLQEPVEGFRSIEEIRAAQKQRDIEISKLLIEEPDVAWDSPLRQLSDQDVQLVQKALSRPDLVQAPVLKFFNNFQLNSRDLSVLGPSQWLNDNVMDYYLALVCERANKGQPTKKVHAFSTFFYKNLSSGGHNSVRRWAKRAGIEGKKLASLDYLIVPINQNNMHWTLAIVNFKRKAFEYYDSLGGTMKEVFPHLRGYVSSESQGSIDLSEWKDVAFGRKGPQQINGYDCGVFVCKTAEVVSRDRVPVFEGKDGLVLRYLMLLDILNGRIHDP